MGCGNERLQARRSNGWYRVALMTDAAQKLFEEAMKLSPEERERVAQQLLDSTTAPNDEMEAEELGALDAAIEESYADEAAGRVRDVFEAFPQLRP